jgi:curli biogenesis system outer membrane secretion channel CsgG
MTEPTDLELALAASLAAFERAAQICRYYLKHQNFPSRWESKSEYEKGIQIACENLAKNMLEEVGKFKVKAAESLEELAANWERAGFADVASTIRSHNNNQKEPLL